jgi:hypothetical protein
MGYALIGVRIHSFIHSAVEVEERVFIDGGVILSLLEFV